jgi:hypothetical protein
MPRDVKGDAFVFIADHRLLPLPYSTLLHILHKRIGTGYQSNSLIANVGRVCVEKFSLTIVKMSSNTQWISVTVKKGPDLLQSSIMKWTESETVGELVSRSLDLLERQRGVTLSKRMQITTLRD